MKTIPTFKLFKLATLAIVVAWGLSVRPAQAVPYVVTLKQVGSNVVATGSGAIDLTGLFLFCPCGNVSGLINPSVDDIEVGSGSADFYSGIFGPVSFGTGSPTSASSSSGDPVGVSGDLLLLPKGYVSGSPLSDTSTYNNATFASLGVTPGVYEWTWGTGANQNFTLKIGAATMPDWGSTFGLLLLALIGLFGANRLYLFRLA
jgi:hypothetical protein